MRAGLISTHALREEGDFYCVKPVLYPADISTHALREEGDEQSIVRHAGPS